jgi:hypothetical protein
VFKQNKKRGNFSLFQQPKQPSKISVLSKEFFSGRDGQKEDCNPDNRLIDQIFNTDPGGLFRIL